MPEQSIAYFASSRTLEFGEGQPFRAVIRYGEGNPLLSGFLLGPEYVAGKVAAAEVPLGEGRIALFGFRVQYRGQALDTFKLLFNALVRAASP
jgi:hypothetical protein